MFSSAEIVAPSFYTRDGANFHLYDMRVGGTARGARREAGSKERKA